MDGLGVPLQGSPEKAKPTEIHPNDETILMNEDQPQTHLEDSPSAIFKEPITEAQHQPLLSKMGSSKNQLNNTMEIMNEMKRIDEKMKGLAGRLEPKPSKKTQKQEKKARKPRTRVVEALNEKPSTTLIPQHEDLPK